jgi:hypothetical protein
VPSQLAGAFGTTGIGLGTVPLALVLSVMVLAYTVAVRYADRLSGRTVLACIAALNALMLLGPPLLSTDVFSYQAYARMFAVYGYNPYLHGPHAIALDSVYPFIGAKWVGTPTAYGPLFTALSALLAPLSLAAAVLVYKGVAALASLALVALVWNIARNRGVDPVKAVVLVGLNPLVVVYGVGGGHNDLLMLTAMMAGVSLLLQHRDRAGAGSVVLATAVKLTGGLLGPFAFAGLANPISGSPRRRREFLIGAAVTTVVLAALSLALFGIGSVHVIDTLRQNQSQGDYYSIPGFISTRLGLGTVGHITGVVLGTVFVILVIWLLRRVWRREMEWLDGAAWATVGLLLTASSMLPWYVAWLLPLAAISRDQRLTRVSVAMTGVITAITLIGYLFHGGAVV